MEKSILQDKPVKRPNLAREIESGLYDRQFMALGRLNPSAISVDEYDKDITYDQTWAKDAYHTYNNSMDNIGVMTERGAIRNELTPKIQDLDTQTNYQETRQQLQQLQQKLRETTVGSDEYNQLSSDILNLTTTMSEQQSGYDEIVRRNGNKERSLQDIQTEREALNADLNDRMERIKEYQADMEQRAKDYTISDEFKDREQGAHDHSVFSKEYMAYAMPGILGSSMNTWKAMVGTAAASYAASRAQTAVLTAATKGAGVHAAVIGEIASNLLAVGTIVGNIYSTNYQRDKESLAQTFGAHKERTKQQLESLGVDDKHAVDVARVKAKADGEDLDNIPDEEIMDRLVSGEMKTGNKDLDTIFNGNRGAIDEVYRRNMALGISDLAQVVMTIPPVGRAFTTAAKAITSRAAIKSLSPTIKKASKGIDFITELGMKSNTTRAKIAKHVTRGVAKVGVNSMLEQIEEGDQNVFDHNFAKGKYDNASGSALGTLLGVAEDKMELAKILVGIDTTSELANDKQLWSDMKGGFATGMLLGGGPIIGHTINDARKDIKANNYVKGVVADNIHNKDQFLKASLYTNKAVQGNQEMVMQAFDELKKYKPDGITDADIDEEIEHAKDIFNAAENPLNQQLAKELRISKSSEQYGKLIGLQGHLRNKVKNIDKELNTSAQQFTTAMGRHALDGSTSMLGIIQNPVRTASKSPFAPPSGMTVQGVNDMVEAFAKTAIAKRALNELITDLDAYSETNKATNLIGDAGISSKHIGTIKKSLVEQLLELDESDALAKDELTADQRIALNNAAETRTMRSKDAINAYKQLSILSSARNTATKELSMLSGIDENGKFLSTLPKEEKAKAVTTLADYLNNINEGLKENSNQITEMRKEAEQRVEKDEAPAVANVEPATVPMSVEDVVPPKKDKEAPKQVENPVEKTPIPEAEVTLVEKATPKTVAKPTSRVEDQNDPDANFGNDDIDLTFDDDESSIKTDEDAKKLFNIPTEPPTPSTKAPTSADMSLLPDDVPEESYDDLDYDDDGYDESFDEFDMPLDYEPLEEEFYDEEGGQGGVRKERTFKTPEEARAKLDNKELLQIEKENLAKSSDIAEDVELLAQLEDAKMNLDFMSSTLFFQPWSTSPLKIIIDGKEVTGHKSGKELSEKLKDPAFTRNAKYEFKIGTYGKVALEENKGTWHNFVVICYIYDTDGNTYATTFRTPETAQAFYDEYNKSTSIQALSENAKVLLFTEQQNSITKLIENRTKVIEAWFNKKDGEHIVPTSVHLSNGKFDVTDKSRPISTIKNLGVPAPENCTPNHVTIGFGRGIRGGEGKEYTIFNPEDGGYLPGFGRSGVLYIYPTTEPFKSGKRTAVAVAKAKIGSVKGLSTLITQSVAYDNPLTDINGNDVPIDTSAFLNTFISYGPLTVDANVPFLTRKQVYYETANGATWLVVGDKYYDFSNITDADFAEIDNHIANNVNFRVGAEEVFKPMREILPGLAEYFDTNDELVLTPEFKITKEDLDLTYLGFLVKNNHLQSNLADNVFKDPFQYAELGAGGNSAIATTAADPKPVAPTKATAEMRAPKNESEKPKIVSSFGKRGYKGGAKYTNVGQSNKPIAEKELKWLRNILGIDSDKLKIVDEITGLLGHSPQVLGLMRQDSIQISTRAVRGVAYHEGYHRLSLLLMSEQERETLYSQFANEHNLPNTTVADKKAIEEMMADDFANYMLNPIRRAKYLVNKWFKALKHFITKTSKLSDARVEDVYHKFATGGYENVKENAASVDRFNELYSNGAPFKIDGVDFKHITNASFKETVDALVAMMFDEVEFTVLADADNLSKEFLISFLNRGNLQMLLENGEYTQSQINALTEISDNFENVFWPRIKKALEKFSLRVIDSEEVMEKEADNATDDSDNFGVSNDLSQHTKASVEISKKANAMAEVKILIATLTDVKEDNGILVAKINETTGFPVFVNFNTAWNRVLNGLHSESTYDGLLKKCAKLSKTDVFFDSVRHTLSTVEDENIRTKILNTISSSFHNMNEINVLDVVDDNGDTIKMLELFDANILRASRIYPTLWNGQLLESDLFVKQDERFVPNTARMNVAITVFDKILQNLNGKLGDITKIKTAMIALLQRIGVSIDIATLNAYINATSDSENEYEQMLNALQAPGKGNLSSLFGWFKAMAESEDGKVYAYGSRTLDIYTFYKGIKSLKDLAIEYAKLNPNPSELTVLGADNSMLYPISQHNYLSGTIDRLNTTPEDVLALSQVTYVAGVKKGNRNVGTGSLIIEQMGRSKAPAKMKFHTMVNFKVKNSADKGRKYTGISEVEDYLMKMCYVANDHIVLPTMGDSSMYNTISGISLLHSSGRVNTLTNGHLQYQFSREALDRMYKYLRTEYETVLNNYNNEKFLEEHPERKVANYHLGTRNGYRFRYFNSFDFVDPKSGQIVAKDFDQMLIEAEQKDGTDLDRPVVKAQLEWIRKNFIDGDRTKIDRMLNDFLLYDFYQELTKAKDLGLIDYDSTADINSFTNKLLDQRQLAKRSTAIIGAGVNSGSLAIVDLLADYFINSAISTIEVEKVFVQDPAYYKYKLSDNKLYFADKSVDKIKRLREILSTGVVPRTDFTDGHSLANKPNFNTATLNDNVLVERQLGSIIGKAKRSYMVDLLRTMHEMSDATAQSMVDNAAHMKKYYSDVVDAATIQADRLSEGYKKVNQTDATVLISPQMYRELVERVDGWSPELEKAYNLLNDPDAKWDTSADLYAEALAITLKPLKFMYFGEHVDTELGLSVPVFDKMAMFPVHRIFSDGDMGEVLTLMEEKNIQMVTFDSAVKVGMRKSTDLFNHNSHINEDGEHIQESILNPELQNIQVYEQQFRNLRRQLITDPHHSERQMFVTQGQKQAVGNIRHDRNYTLATSKSTVTGSELRSVVKKSLDALTVKGRERIYKRFGITEDVDSDGNLLGYNLDIDLFYAELKQKAENSDMNQNVVQALTKLKDKSYVPLSSISDNNWIESALTSIFNKEIIDVNLPGGMFIQMSSVLYNRVSVGSDKGLTRQLNYINEDGSMDCVVTLNLLKHILPKGNKFTFSEAKAWLTERKVIGPDAEPIAMGYRIPAQGQSSLAALKVVDIYPEQIGDTITLPDAFTTLTGSDFD